MCEITKNFLIFATLLVENFLHVNICRKAIFSHHLVPFNYLIMLADYFNNPLISYKWYEVARTREKCIIKKVDVFMYLSLTHDDAFELLYVAYDETNRRMMRNYHGKFVIKMTDDYLIIRHGLWRKKYLIVAKNDDCNLVALSNRRKSKVWILSHSLPYDNADFDEIMKSLENQGFDTGNIELFYK